MASPPTHAPIRLTTVLGVNKLTGVNEITPRDRPVNAKRKVSRELAPREDQIMSALYHLRRASVAEVRQRLADPPSYSAVRTMLGHLERKGLVKRDRSGVTHVYLPVKSSRAAGLAAFKRLRETFFPDAPGEALATLIDSSAKQLTDADIERLERAIEQARKRESR